MSNVMTEEQLIRLAIDSARFSQFLARLGNPKTRREKLYQLNHRPSLHPGRTTWYSRFTKALKDVKIPGDSPVYLLSATSALDQKTMPFRDAIEAVPVAGWGTIIGVSEHLAIYYGEEGERAAIIRIVAPAKR